MTTDTQNHQAIRGLLENALQQVLSTQEQVTAIESQLQEIKSQIGLSLEAIDPVLKQCETGNQAEKVRNDVAATLGEMIEHVSRIVNETREKMLKPRSDEFHDVTLNATGAVTVGAITDTVNEVTREAKEALAEVVSDEPTPAESLPEESLSAELPAAETLTGPQVGQRATESLNEMIATIDESNTETNAEAAMSQDEVSESEPETESEAETPVAVSQKPAAEMETPTVVSQEQEPEPVVEQLPDTAASEPALPEVPALFEAEVKSAEKEAPKGPGSADSLSELLAKAKAASSETGSPATDLTPLDDEEEDAQTVSELLKTTSGSFATQ